MAIAQGPAACSAGDCANAPAAMCGRCGQPFCAAHGIIRGRRFRGLYDTCRRCATFSPLRYLAYLARVAAIVGGLAFIGWLLVGQPGLLLGALVGMVVAIVALWGSVPE